MDFRKRTALAATAVMAVSLSPVMASEASATSLSTWNRLARCESGGRWHLNTGNGYYGGLQFSAGTWRAYGGGRYARVASGTSKWHQIQIAERVRRGQGWGAWPSCSRRLGL